MSLSRRHLFGLLAAAPVAIPAIAAAAGRAPVSDPQRAYNYWASSRSEVVALAPKGPWVDSTNVRFRTAPLRIGDTYSVGDDPQRWTIIGELPPK